MVRIVQTQGVKWCIIKGEEMIAELVKTGRINGLLYAIIKFEDPAKSYYAKFYDDMSPCTVWHSAYIERSPSLPTSFDDPNYNGIKINGGLTFGGKIKSVPNISGSYLGYDYSHLWNATQPSIDEIMGDLKSLALQLKELERGTK